ncbi:type IV secretion system protein TrbL [Tistlia consotensis]|uniref:Type IV secretion system protein TrbL n=1 Tax=Tistlia consotensis USBA 355 TaxID=560819 RepID=A0A1Y6CS20_9PROT|nr:P-type conjugative transfer protein TrbL [Tistlia consotensis]SMF84147.1 type IV secretion system protein TrbL [Tistlia consotensis USBA 355]SNS35769.1 type IV secretion system protein TrbL [Tistlia consotensis]
MNTGVADHFLDVFTRYIDSGFGLLGGEVAFLASTLVVIDVVMAALFWAWSPGEEIVARLVKKTIYVGFFAFILSNFNGLAKIIFESFSGLGLKAAGSGMSASDFLHPGKLAQAGIDAGTPILQAIHDMSGFPEFFNNFIQIVVLFVGWLLVLIAFFILAVQLFVTLIEFKLTTLAGFVLVPFGLFNKTAFLAERVLGNVIASGVKVLVLAVIVGIGSTLFSQFTQASPGGAPSTIEDVLSLALASLCLLGLGIFGPGIATGLVSGAPQLGAGAAVGTALTAGGIGLAGAYGLRAAAGGLAGLAGRGAALASASRPGPTGSGDGGLRPPPAGGPGPSSLGGGGSSARPTFASAASGGGSSAPPSGSAPAAPSEPPAWARRMENAQAVSHGVSMAAHSVGASDHGGGSTGVSLSEERT